MINTFVYLEDYDGKFKKFIEEPSENIEKYPLSTFKNGIPQ